ncbi:MAG: sulfite oxidase heme-binding subunit YedZ [Gemmatimonadaceae bacterium]
MGTKPHAGSATADPPVAGDPAAIVVGDPGTARGAPPESQSTALPRARTNRKSAAHIKQPRYLHAVIIALGLIPFIWAGFALWSDLYRGTNYLTAEPVTELEHFTGKWTLRFLAFTLAIAPAIAMTRLGWLIKYRRTFGLLAFFYACTHFTVYLTLDLELRFSDIWEDISERAYITIGFTALMLLVPLAITSTKAMIRRLGNKRWKAIHRMVYVTSVLGIIHFWMSVKRDLTSPILFSLLFASLLGWRVWRATRGTAA